MMTRIFEYRLEVPPTAIDVQGHANNVEFVRWLQDAAVAHARESGCTAATRDAGAAWVVRTHHVEYLRPAFAGDRLKILTWVSNFRRAFSLRKYKVLRESDNVLLATGQTDWVFVGLDHGRPRTIPADIAAMFELVPEEAEP